VRMNRTGQRWLPLQASHSSFGTRFRRSHPPSTRLNSRPMLSSSDVAVSVLLTPRKDKALGRTEGDLEQHLASRRHGAHLARVPRGVQLGRANGTAERISRPSPSSARPPSRVRAYREIELEPATFKTEL
jgi:hypothetical protein